MKTGPLRRLAKNICYLVLAICWLPSQSHASEFSGTFFGGGKDFVVLLQLLPAGEGKIVGRLRETSIDAKGAKRTYDRPVSGAANRDSFVGKLEGDWSNGGNMAISGKFSDGVLRVNAANGLNVSLRRGDEQDFSRGVEKIVRQSSDAQQQKALSEVRRKSEQTRSRVDSEIARLRSNISDFSRHEPQNVQTQALAAQRYGDIGEKMRAKILLLYEATEQTGTAQGKRSSLGANIYHLSIEASHIQIDVSNAQRRFESNAERLLNGIGEAQAACQSLPRETGHATKLRRECALVPQAKTTLAQTTIGVRDGYAILENAWLKTSDEHMGLLEKAQSFQKQHDLRR